MKTFTDFITEARKTVDYAAHNDFGSPAKKVLARRSPSSAGDEEEDGRIIKEGNPLRKVVAALKNKGERGSTSYMATVSPERGGMTAKEKREAHGKMQAAIRRHADKGMIKTVGGPKQSGEYRYADPSPDEEGVAKEKSYVLVPGNHPKARKNFHRIVRSLGKNADQESVLKIRKKGSDRPTGSLLYTTGKDAGKSKPVGKMHINTDMPIEAGRTKFKGKKAAFVVKKDDEKNDDK